MNGPTHRLVAGSVAALFVAHREHVAGTSSGRPIMAGLATALTTCLPDILEPATSPNHRQFFHSVVWASLIVAGMSKLREWQPTEPGEILLKELVMCAAAGYLIHLALDALTKKSLPLLGKL